MNGMASALPKPAGLVPVRAVINPFGAFGGDFSLPEGLSIAEMIAQLQPDTTLTRYGHVYVGEDYIAPEFWQRVRPKAGAIVTIRLVPGKGGGKSPLRAILTIAVIAASFYLGPMLGTALIGSGGFWAGSVFVTAGTIGSAIIGMAGTLAVNAIAPPAQPKLASNLSSAGNAATSATLFIEGARNVARPYSPIPMIYGRHIRVPDLGAATYTETVGDDQYVRQLFIWGYAPMQISQLKIGDTLMENFSNVEIEHYLAGGDIETIGLYPSRVDQDDFSVTMSQKAGWVRRTTKPNTDEIIVDVTFPQGLFRLDKKGKRQSYSIALEIRYASIGTDDWLSQSLVLSRSHASTMRRSYRYRVPVGEYDVEVRRVSKDDADDTFYSEFAWTALRSIAYSPPIVPKGLAFSVLRMKATDQLNGAVDQLNAICESIIPDWDAASQTWIERPTQNPASHFRHALQGPANKRPLSDARIDLARIQYWHERNRIRGLTFNHVVDYQATVGGIANDIAAAGRASRATPDGKWSVVIDEAKTVPVQHFTPRNSWGYEGSIAYPDVPHGVRVTFINEKNGWQQDERIVYADGYSQANATRFETLELPGITDPDLIHIHAREHLAVMQLRPEMHGFSADVEHLVCNRGDLIRFAHDVPLVGVGVARIKTVILDGAGKAKGIVVDNDIAIETGPAYGVRIRRADGVEIASTLAGAVEGRSFIFSQPVDAIDMAAGDLAMFGEVGREVLDLVVHSIEPGPDLTAKVVAVDAAPGIFAASGGPIPAWDSLLTPVAALQRPLPPVIDRITTDETAMVRNIDGSFAARMIVTLTNLNSFAVEPIVKIRQSGSTDYGPATVEYSDTSQVILTRLDAGLYYDLEIRYRKTAPGLAGTANSPPVTALNTLFIGESGRPSTVQDFALQVIDTIAILSWSAIRDADFAYYQIRFTPGAGDASWNSSQVLLSNIRENRVTVPAQFGTFLIKAFDHSGGESETAAQVVPNAINLKAFNVVEQLTEDPDFAGVKVNCAVAADYLAMIDPSAGTALYGFAEMVDFGEIYTARVTPDIAAFGERPSNVMSSWVRLADVTSLSGGDPANWRVQVEIATSQAAPSSNDWTDFAPIVVGDYTCRAMRFRLRLSSIDGQTVPIVRHAAVAIDMPDRLEDGVNVPLPATGLTISYAPPFKKLPAVTITNKVAQAGDVIRFLQEDRGGFTIKAFDASGVAVDRVIDWIAKGYGREYSQ